MGALQHRDRGETLDTHRLSIDFRRVWNLAPGWRFGLSDRLDQQRPIDDGDRSTLNSLREAYDRLRELLVEVLAAELRDLAAYRAIAEAVQRQDDLSAAAVARALMEEGSSAIFQLIAVIEEEGDTHVERP